MSKWVCDKCGDEYRCVLDVSGHGSVNRLDYCPIDGWGGNWRIEEEAVTDCNQLPKLAVEVEGLKTALKQIAEIANRRGHLTVATWQKYAWYEVAKIAKEALANDTDTGKTEEWVK